MGTTKVRAARGDVPFDVACRRLADRMGHVFADTSLLHVALTHRSFSANHYERLEFLGDSVLGLAVSHFLFTHLKDAPEGDLSRIRANLVRQESLHSIALQLDLPAALRLGEGELRSGGASRPSILADALEAVIGAVYLDAGYAAAQAVVFRLFQSVDISAHALAAKKDAKTSLQEWLQARKIALPSYSVTGIEGKAHMQVFQVLCELPELKITQLGSGGSRRAAEQDAAAKMLERLLQQPSVGKSKTTTAKHK